MINDTEALRRICGSRKIPKSIRDEALKLLESDEFSPETSNSEETSPASKPSSTNPSAQSSPRKPSNPGNSNNASFEGIDDPHLLQMAGEIEEIRKRMFKSQSTIFLLHSGNTFTTGYFVIFERAEKRALSLVIFKFFPFENYYSLNIFVLEFS